MAITSDFVAEHADAVWRTAFRLLNNREDALDCYQQTFLDAMHLDGGSIRNWRSTLCCITTRRAMDRLRERYREHDLRKHGDVQRQFESAPDQPALNDELRQQVRQKLSTLPAQQAEAFWLRHVEQISPAEIARVMKIEPGHVRVLVHRAAEQLRKSLAGSYALKPSKDKSHERR